MNAQSISIIEVGSADFVLSMTQSPLQIALYIGGSRRQCQGGPRGGGGGKKFYCTTVSIPLRRILVHRLYSVA